MLTGWNEIRKARTDGQADRQVDRQEGSVGQSWGSHGLPPACIIDGL